MNTTIVARPFRVPSGRTEKLRAALLLGSIALSTVLVLKVAAGLASWDFFVFLLACAIFVGVLFLARPFSGRAIAGHRAAFLSATLVVWIFLMISEAIFAHSGTTNGAVAGHFDASAYYEAASWILYFVALAFITCFRPAYLRGMFRGPLKWASIFAIIAVLSCPLSPVPTYSLALAFKLCVVVLCLAAIGEAMDAEADVPMLFSALLVGTLIITVLGFVKPFLGSGPAFENGRLGAMTGLSGTAGILLLLSVLFLLLKKNPWFLVSGAFSLVVMMLAGVKGGIVASFLSLMMFFAFLKKARQALAACMGFTIVFLLCVAFTPLGQYLQSYSASGNVGTLTGRTNLWVAVWPDIEQRPIFGHGYRASRFVSAEVQGAFAEADHIHNTFLEILYNNGIVGLLPILIMSVVIVINLARVIKRPATPQARYYGAAALALYLHLLLWGVTAPTFGSAPDNRFMTFFTVLVISMFLKAQTDKQALNRR
jgi:O-antigen ligase